MSEVAIFCGYEISNEGKVYSVAHNWRGYGKRQLQFVKDRDNYLCVRLTIDGFRKKFRVHRLVADHFLPARPSAKHEVRHLNGDKFDNRAVNLCWGTQKENAADRYLHGRTSCGLPHSEAVRNGMQIAMLKGVRIGRPTK